MSDKDEYKDRGLTCYPIISRTNGKMVGIGRLLNNDFEFEGADPKVQLTHNRDNNKCDICLTHNGSHWVQTDMTTEQLKEFKEAIDAYLSALKYKLID